MFAWYPIGYQMSMEERLRATARYSAMFDTEITNSWTAIGYVVVSAAVMLCAIIATVRVVGLRSFSKMSSFDFVVTVAMGSLLAAISLSDSSLVDGVVAVVALFGLQAIIALGRRHAGLGRVVDNTPLLLMVGPRMIEENLTRSRVTADDIRGKLREANVRNYDEVRYVVIEATGDVSVVHGAGDLDPDIFGDVRDHQLILASLEHDPE